MTRRLSLLALTVISTSLFGFVGPAQGAEIATPKLGKAVNTGTFRLTSFDATQGFTGRIQLTTYGVRRASAPPALPYSHRTTAACATDPATAAVVPVVVRITNTSKGFPEPVWFVPGVSTDQGPNADAIMDLGNACGQLGYRTVIFDTVQPGQSVLYDFFVVLPNYYTRAHHRGDLATLRSSCVGGQVSFGQGKILRYVGSKGSLALVKRNAKC